MVNLIQKGNYWYLLYSYKENRESKTIEKYLGKEVPKNILSVQEEFKEEVFRQRFGDKVDRIAKNFRDEFKGYNSVVKKKYMEQFAIKFTYNSQAIEGSTLNLKDTALLIERGIAPAKKFDDIELSKTHYEVFLEILKKKENLSLSLVLEWHKKLFEKTYPQIAGKLRNHPVRVMGSKSVFPFYAKINVELKIFFDWYEKNKSKIHPLRLAALVHLKFVSIHPFTDGNGRVSRLLMNYVLFLNAYPLLDIDYVKRNSYYNSLESDQTKGTEHVFVDYIAKKFIKDYEKYL